MLYRFSQLHEALLAANNSLYARLWTKPAADLIAQMSAGLPGIAYASSDEWQVIDFFAEFCNVKDMHCSQHCLRFAAQNHILHTASRAAEYCVGISKERRRLLSALCACT